MMQRLVTTCLACALCAAAAHAGVGGPWAAQMEYTAPAEVSVFMVPDGSGSALTEAVTYGGVSTDASIRIQIVDGNGDPIAGYPGENLWLVFGPAGAAADGCGDEPFAADADTDADGWARWSLPLRGGGFAEGPVQLTIFGAPIENFGDPVVQPLAIRTNSADISGDLVVNLTDIVLFSENLGLYHYRSDFNWDGSINLSDIVRFTPAIGAVCP